MPIRNYLSWMICSLLLFVGSVISLNATEPKPANTVWRLKLSGVIGPASSDLLTRNLQDAATQDAHLFVVHLDTPGGLDSSMRRMIKVIIDSPVPVATFVHPKGARAASAGTYLLYASHIAAMAPATNLGAATPVQIGMTPPQPKDPSTTEEQEDRQGEALQNPMQKKIMNDAAAYIRGLAELHGRNADWAEKAVRDAASMSAAEALENGVIDLMANDLNDLLTKLDGRTLMVRDQTYVLNTFNYTLNEIQPDWRYDFLSVITNPNVAYILMLIGLYGLLLEFYNPGVGLPGVLGGISLLIALYAFQLLPVSYAGLALIALGVGLMITEAMSPSFGIFGIGGVISFAIGSVLLMDTELPAFQIALPIIAAFTAVTGGLCIFVLAMALKSRRSAVVSGPSMLVGQQAIVLDDLQTSGKVRIHGEIWNARSQSPLKAGDTATVLSVRGLVLEIGTVVPNNTGDTR